MYASAYGDLSRPAPTRASYDTQKRGEKQDELNAMAQSLDPLRLFEQLEQLQKALFSCAVEGNQFVSNATSLPIRVFSVQQCTIEVGPVEGGPPDAPAGLTALHQELEKRKRVLGWRRTHKGPFEREWDQIFSWLVANREREPRRYISGAAAPLSRTLSTLANSYADAEACGKYEFTCFKLSKSNGKKK